MATQQNQVAYAELSSLNHINNDPTHHVTLSKDEFYLYCNLTPELNPESATKNDLTTLIRKSNKYYEQIDSVRRNY